MEIAFKDACSFSYGKMPKKEKIGHGSFQIFTGYKYLDSYPEYNCDQGDVIVVARGVGGSGDVKIVNKKSYLTNLSIKFTLNNEILLNTYCFYYFQWNNLRYLDSGSAQSQITINDLEKVILKLPSIPEQKAIASALSSLDDKIDLLHRQNKTLESMAETLFRQWFILDSTGVSVSIDQIIDFNPKRTLIKSQDATYLDMAGLSTVIFRANGYYRRPFSSGTKFTKRDTLLARITPCLENGKAAYIDFLDDNETGWGSTEFIVMRPKKEIHPFISYIMCRNPDFKEYAESCMEGSTGRQRVNLDHLKKFNVNLPTEASLRIINELLDSFESKLINNSKQIDSLEKLRDTLLPKLMSGDVRVQYAEEAIASVA
ncbi:TPA: restriction endonuclease subunit S [Escherichia coli]|nr:restriction endonuclease subunit S [Escherichia coli]HCN8395404.1 restriction endonuclease subunit S [Escherichia coli]